MDVNLSGCDLHADGLALVISFLCLAWLDSSDSKVFHEEHEDIETKQLRIRLHKAGSMILSLAIF